MSFKALKDFTLTKTVKSIPDVDRDKLRFVNGWIDVRKWMNDDAKNFSIGLTYMIDQEAVDNFGALMADNATVFYYKDLIYWKQVKPKITVLADNSTTFIGSIVYKLLNAEKVFQNGSDLTAPALKCFKKYFGDNQTVWNYRNGNIYSSENIKPEIEKGTLKLGEDVAYYWDDIFWTKDADIIRDWWNKLLPYWYGDGKLGTADSLNIDGLKAIRQKINLLEQNQQDPKIIEEWKTDFLKDFDNKSLSVDSLKAVKASLEQFKTDKATYDKLVAYWKDNFMVQFGIQPLSIDTLTKTGQVLQVFKDANDYWSSKDGGFDKQFGESINKDNLGKVKLELDRLKTIETNSINLTNYYKELGFGDTIDKDSLKKIKDKLDVLNADLKAIYPNYPTITEEEKPENVKKNIKGLEDKIETLTNESKGKDTTISDRDNTIKDKDIIIDNLKDLPEKLKELNKQLDDKDIELGKRNDVITSLTTERNTAQGDLKTWTDVFGNKTPTEINANQEKHTDYDQIKTGLDAWTATFPNLDVSQVKIEYDKDKEKHTDKDLRPAKLPIDWEIDLARIPELEANLSPADLPTNWKEQLATIPILKGNQKPADLPSDWKDQLDKIPSLELRPTQEDLNNAVGAEKDKYKDYETNKTELDKWHDTFKDKKPDEVLTERPVLSQTDKDKITNFDAVNNKLEAWQTNFPNQEPSQIKNQVEQQANQPIPTPNQDNQYLNKLLDLYKKEIKKRTELFHQELSLDNNEINAKYGDRNKSFLDLLITLKGESDPDQVINAFKIVALAVASEKSKKLSDEMETKKVPAGLKKNRIAQFKKIQDNWDLISEIPKKENNPLYLPLVDDLVELKNKHKLILEKWQAT